VLFEFDGRKTLGCRENQGNLTLDVPALSGEAAVIVVRRGPAEGAATTSPKKNWSSRTVPDDLFHMPGYKVSLYWPRTAKGRGFV